MEALSDIFLRNVILRNGLILTGSFIDKNLLRARKIFNYMRFVEYMYRQEEGFLFRIY